MEIDVIWKRLKELERKIEELEKRVAALEAKYGINQHN